MHTRDRAISVNGVRLEFPVLLASVFLALITIVVLLAVVSGPARGLGLLLLLLPILGVCSGKVKISFGDAQVQTGSEDVGSLDLESDLQRERSANLRLREELLAEREKYSAVPAYWKNQTGFHCVRSSFVQSALQQFIMDSSAACRCDNASATKNAHVVSVERVENEFLWKMYQTRRLKLQKSPGLHTPSMSKLCSKTDCQPRIPSAEELDKGINEFYLFHGTSSETAAIISEHGFDEHRAELNGLYGAGSYFACNACKSHQYALAKKGTSADFVLLLCRVAMGVPFCTKKTHQRARLPPDNDDTPGQPYDSIFAGNGIANSGSQYHNEYVIFDRSQVYPEYIVRYRV